MRSPSMKMKQKLIDIVVERHFVTHFPDVIYVGKSHGETFAAAITLFATIAAICDAVLWRRAWRMAFADPTEHSSAAEGMLDGSCCSSSPLHQFNQHSDWRLVD